MLKTELVPILHRMRTPQQNVGVWLNTQNNKLSRLTFFPFPEYGQIYHAGLAGRKV